MTMRMNVLKSRSRCAFACSWMAKLDSLRTGRSTKQVTTNEANNLRVFSHTHTLSQELDYPRHGVTCSSEGGGCDRARGAVPEQPAQSNQMGQKPCCI